MNFTSYLLVLLLLGVFIPSESDASEIKDIPHVNIISDKNLPYIYKNEKGNYEGSSIELIRKVFKKAEISFDLTFMPWKRAVKLHKSDNQLMVFPVARLREREELFKWIFPLHTLELKLFGLKSNVNTQANIKSGEFTFVCSAKSVHCAALEQKGVPASSIVAIAGVHNKQMLKMVMRGRVDFIVISEISLVASLKESALDKDLFIALDNFNYEIKEYLAGSKNIDMSIVMKLQEAAREIEIH